MKTYTNGQRKGMMYGGAAKRKPMMYGGMATKKPRKKAQAGGMMTATQPQQNMMQNQAMQQPMMKMAGGGKLKMVKNKAGKMVPDFAADGKGIGWLLQNDDADNGGKEDFGDAEHGGGARPHVPHAADECELRQRDAHAVAAEQ